MIFRILDQLRGKSEATRRQVVLVFTGSIMFIIVSVWFGTLPNRFSQTAEETKDTTSPFSVIAEQGKSFIGDITNSVAQIKNTFSTDGLSKEDFPAAAVLSLPLEDDTQDLVPDLLGDTPYFGDEFTETQRATTTR